MATQLRNAIGNSHRPVVHFHILTQPNLTSSAKAYIKKQYLKRLFHQLSFEYKFI